MKGASDVSKISLETADLERRDDAETWCKSCRAPAEEKSPYCLHCGWYWDDVDSGLYEEPFDDAI